MAKVPIAIKVTTKFILHGLAENGGRLMFNKYNFGIEISGDGNYREIKLITYPESESYEGVTVRNNNTKKKKFNYNVSQDTEEER